MAVPTEVEVPGPFTVSIEHGRWQDHARAPIVTERRIVLAEDYPSLTAEQARSLADQLRQAADMLDGEKPT